MSDGELTDLVDLTACDREPIHIPGSIQPHGALLGIVGAEHTIVHASANAAAFLGVAPVLGRTRLGEVVGDGRLEADIAVWLAGDQATMLRSVRVGEHCFNVVTHRGADDVVLVEFEEAPDSETHTLDALYPRLRHFIEQLQNLSEIAALASTAARQVRELTGFDRVLIYRFDEDGAGTVIGEDRNDALPAYLDLRFPGSDIPKQARELYRLNRTRIIPDALYQPVPLLAHPDYGKEPLDLTHSVLRSVSPVHVEYMRNMGTHASMSVSILIEGELWGLIACHNAEAKRVPLQLRGACDLLGQVLAAQMGALIRTQEIGKRVRLKSLQTELLSLMAQEDVFSDALLKNPSAWRGLASADGAAVIVGQTLLASGACPREDQIREIVSWLEETKAPDVFATDALPDHMPSAAAFIDKAAGVLAITVSEMHASYILWFRPEAVRTVNWSGDPRKPAGAVSDDRLHPRQSFEIWKEQVRGRSLPWDTAELEAARELRAAVIAIVLRQAEEMASLSDELQRSNKELEAFSYSISHDLRAPFRHIVGYAELLTEREGDKLDPQSGHYLESIKTAAISAGRLVDDLLGFSHLGRASLATSPTDMDKLVTEARRTLEPETQGRHIDWKVSALPPAQADPSLVRQVLVNLIGNALKYSRGRNPAVIEVSGRIGEDGQAVYTVRDNGVGFDMAYAGKLFGVFQRLHRIEEFEGTGIGLAISRRIVERHRGRIWAEGAVGQGAAFHFTLPPADA
ncbi:MAG: GAF domain-containing protein [Proteobacteria bacterium]|nr:GAF domain-containing protein [Pseudomonadota bacterium]